MQVETKNTRANNKRAENRVLEAVPFTSLTALRFFNSKDLLLNVGFGLRIGGAWGSTERESKSGRGVSNACFNTLRAEPFGRAPVSSGVFLAQTGSGQGSAGKLNVNQHRGVSRLGTRISVLFQWGTEWHGSESSVPPDTCPTPGLVVRPGKPGRPLQ